LKARTEKTAKSETGETNFFKFILETKLNTRRGNVCKGHTIGKNRDGSVVRMVWKKKHGVAKHLFAGVTCFLFVIPFLVLKYSLDFKRVS
jgi:hypothetical protein